MQKVLIIEKTKNIPALDKLVFEANYFKYIEKVVGHNKFKTTEDLANNLIERYKCFEADMLKSDDPLYLDVVAAFNSGNQLESMIQFFVTMEPAFFLLQDYDDKLSDFCMKNSLPVDYKSRLEELFLNLYISGFFERITQSTDQIFEDEIANLENTKNVINEIGNVFNQFNLNLEKKKLKEPQLEIIKRNIDEFKMKISRELTISILSEKAAEKNFTLNDSIELLKKGLFPSIFKHGRKENSTFNHFLLNLYLLSKSVNENAFMPLVIKTLIFLKNETPIKLETIELSESSIRKRIREIEKKRKAISFIHSNIQ